MNGTFFGLQLAIRSPAGDPWRERIVALLRENQTDQDAFEKRALYTRLSQLLSEVSERWTLGTWDLITGTRGRAEFDDWAEGLEASVNEPLDPMAASGDHAVVSVIFLVEEGGRSDATLGERCDLPESVWYQRSTYERLVATLRLLNFPGVLADGVYLVPGEPGCGIGLGELRGEGWDYLRPVE